MVLQLTLCLSNCIHSTVCISRNLLLSYLKQFVIAPYFKIGSNLASSLEAYNIFLIYCLLCAIQAALSLEKRPLLHNSAFMLVFNLFLAVICRFLCSSRITMRTVAASLCCIFTVAWTTHHLRDGLRRGIWIAPFGHTPPLPNWLYLAATTVVPLTVRILLLVDVANVDHDLQLLDV